MTGQQFAQERKKQIGVSHLHCYAALLALVAEMATKDAEFRQRTKDRLTHAAHTLPSTSIGGCRGHDTHRQTHKNTD